MIDRNYFSHSIPGYGKVWDKLNAIGYCYNVAGENIGWNNYPDDIATAAIQQAFMDSPGHRREHHGQDLGRHRHRRLQGPDRQEDVDGPVRRQVRLDRPEADAQAHAQADRRRPTPRPTPKPAPKATPRPTPKPARRPSSPRRRRPSSGPSPRSPGDNLIFPRAAAAGRADASAVRTDLDPRLTISTRRSGSRVVDRQSTDGLLGTIVGGVAGFFFGGG